MRFCCVECGQEANADLVAAINVGRAGLARIACEVNGGVRSSAAGTQLGRGLAATPGSPLLQVGADVKNHGFQSQGVC
ncbi:MAG TPA: hypothetical protein VN833_18925, partial [Candidatus Acidoferrales bacterium]|nr:hypothetical protein [Candidatus Acidoferrales bacterium]